MYGGIISGKDESRGCLSREEVPVFRENRRNVLRTGSHYPEAVDEKDRSVGQYGYIGNPDRFGPRHKGARRDGTGR